VTANGLNLDFDQLLAVSDGWARDGGAVRLIGDWHSHPDRSTTPSRKDVKAWVAAFDMVAAEHPPVSHYFGLIVGPARPGRRR
jgi:Prokaryotic homologs of the JAB domain